MAAPNVVGVTTITGKTDGLAVTTSKQAIVQNLSSSNQLFKINTLIAGNLTAGAVTVSVDVSKGATQYRIAEGVNVPANSTIVILAKDSAVYLEENDSLRISSNTSSALEAVCSYEIIE